MPEFHVGTRVIVAEHGLGTVIVSGEDYLAVAFDDGCEALFKRSTTAIRLASEAEDVANPDEPSTIERTSRPWPESTFVFEEPGAAHYLGSHWLPFVDDPVEIFKRLPEISRSLVPFEGFGDGKHRAPGEIPSDWPNGAHLARPAPDVSLMATLRIEKDANRIVAVYPFHQLGSQHTMRLRTVTVWEDGCTAQLTASIGSAELTFFDTAYLSNRVWYQAGWVYDFILTGFAYSARPAEQMEIEVDAHPEIVRWLETVRGEGSAELEDGPQTSFSLAGMAALIPIEEWDRDDYEFRGTVTEVKEVHDILGQDGWRVRTTVLRDVLDADELGDDRSGDLGLDIVITRKAWEGSEAPRVGQDIEGHLWLQGRLDFPHAHETMHRTR